MLLLRSRITLRYYLDFVTTCSHGTDCHAESPAGKVWCFEMAKIDPVSPFYPILLLKKAILQKENLKDVRKTSHWAVNIYKLEVFTQYRQFVPPAYHENS